MATLHLKNDRTRRVSSRFSGHDGHGLRICKLDAKFVKITTQNEREEIMCSWCISDLAEATPLKDALLSSWYYSKLDWPYSVTSKRQTAACHVHIQTSRSPVRGRARDTGGLSSISHFFATAITDAIFASGVVDDIISQPQIKIYDFRPPEKFRVVLEKGFWSRYMTYHGLSRSRPLTANLQLLYRITETIVHYSQSQI
ncbi:hypothetical protein PoMZ_05202 [Pyricularia oryzae]|uniref:Uncharacterized protein n=1 Tax=Pyricularia oryzae TaxID=318829 RepID=A0A4P7NN11_PYROR|nr:hypothetical protein PoMZ_05202 [Pyricularia oryzae]